MIYPPFSNIREISANIAAKVAAKAYELGSSFSYYTFHSWFLSRILLFRIFTYWMSKIKVDIFFRVGKKKGGLHQYSCVLQL